MNGYQTYIHVHVYIRQSPNAQDTFQPILDIVSCTGVAGSVDITHHVGKKRKEDMRG